MVKTWARHKTTETVLNNGWRLAVGGWWRSAADSVWQLVVGGGWQLAVGGPWGLSLTKKNWTSQGQPCDNDARCALSVHSNWATHQVVLGSINCQTRMTFNSESRGLQGTPFSHSVPLTAQSPVLLNRQLERWRCQQRFGHNSPSDPGQPYNLLHLAPHLRRFLLDNAKGRHVLLFCLRAHREGPPVPGLRTWGMVDSTKTQCTAPNPRLAFPFRQ